MFNVMQDFQGIGSEALLIGWALVLLLVGVLKKGSHYIWMTLSMVTILALGISLVVMPHSGGAALEGVSLFFGSLEISSLTQSMKGFYLLMALFVIGSIGYGFSSLEDKRTEYLSLFLFSVVGGSLLFSANDFMVVFIALEISSFSIYIMIALWAEGKHAAEAALKYFMTGGLASAFLLLGIAFVYGQCGSMQFGVIAQTFQALIGEGMGLATLSYVGIVMIIGALCCKLAVAPFHMWSPDVYVGSSPPVLVLLGTLPKIAIVSLLMLLLRGPFAAIMPHLQLLISILAIVSMLWGGVGALMQTNFRRLVAYSTVLHMGFVLLGMLTLGTLGLESFHYTIVYTLSFIGLMGFVGHLEHQGEQLETLEGFNGLAKRFPFHALCISMLFFSMAGIPPLAGFFAKFIVLKVALTAGNYSVVFAAIISSILGAAYALRIVRNIYFHSAPEILPTRSRIQGDVLFVLSNSVTYLAASLILFFVFYFIFFGGVISLG